MSTKIEINFLKGFKPAESLIICFLKTVFLKHGQYFLLSIQILREIKNASIVNGNTTRFFEQNRLF